MDQPDPQPDSQQDPGQDPGPTPQPAPAPAPAEPPQGGAAPSGYQNLWVPLIVVPFLVVGVLVIVFLFFGAIRGRDATLEENLQVLIHGGTNERQQAAVSLSAQVVENRQAREQGRELPWEADEDFLDQLQGAWDAMGPDDNPNLRLAVAKALQEYGDPEARAKLEGFLELTDDVDGDGQLRFYALLELGQLGDPRAAAAVIPFLASADPLLQQGAASALQSMPGPDTVEALKGVLGASSLELRGMAAISLSHLGDASGAHVLLDLVDPDTYTAIQADNPRKYADPRLVQNSRIYAVQALARLNRDEDLDLLKRIADGDADPEVREAAMRAVRDR